MKPIIIFMGVPGSGKGTQAERLVALGYGHISTGNLLRALAQDEHASQEDKQELEDMKSGKLVSNKLIYKLAFAEINKQIALGKGIVLDGAIRTLDQANAYQHFFKEQCISDHVIVFNIAISDEESMRRSQLRRQYAERGELVPAVAQSKQGKESSVPTPRADDDPEIVKKRLEEQGNNALAPILHFYKELGTLITIDGMLSIDEIEQEIQQHIHNFV